MASPSLSARAVNPDDLPAPTASEIARAARRHATLAALFGLTAVGDPASAQMGAHGMRGQQPESPRPDKDARDTRDANPPRDLVAAFARRLRDGVPDLALTPPQQDAWRDFVASLGEVGQHNERRLQRILWRSASTVSAVAPLRSYIAAEVDEGEGRQEALAELKVNFDKLDSLIDARQRDIVTNLFVATRSELQASRS
jgi:hypothetical protein